YDFNPSTADNAAPASPAESPAASSDAKPDEKELMRLEARLVNLNIKATDRAGNPLANLTKDDFVVYEDGVEQEIAFFEPQSARINLVLLLDLSGSTEDKRKVMIKAAKKFIDTLDPNDPIAIAAFTREFFVLSDFTTDRKLLKKKVEKIKDINGGTAFYDSLWKTFDLFKSVTEARKAIVVLTDGVDNSLVRVGYHPTDHTFEDVLARVSEEDATIYPVYLDTDEELRKYVAKSNDASSSIIRKIVSERKRPSEIAREQLEALAEHTAGKLFKAESERDLEGVYERVASELHLLYSIGYAPKNTQNDGKFRKTSVTLKREGSIAKTRRGYYAR
ncbi:MAG TPA: VWA domain-containing protein, partial [Blastocatellia bacterium]|nr:VWA domain-containing protein [Blastocatellia bacterium]